LWVFRLQPRTSSDGLSVRQRSERGNRDSRIRIAVARPAGQGKKQQEDGPYWNSGLIQEGRSKSLSAWFATRSAMEGDIERMDVSGARRTAAST
jgi:hypothetical protein